MDRRGVVSCILYFSAVVSEPDWWYLIASSVGLVIPFLFFQIRQTPFSYTHLSLLYPQLTNISLLEPECEWEISLTNTGR
jgi:hypothetical protein